MPDMKTICVRLANRFGWLYEVEQSVIDWYWLKLELKRSLPTSRLLSAAIIASTRSGFAVASTIEFILAVELVAVHIVRDELNQLAKLMQNS